MKNVSSQFRRELNNGNRNYVKSAKITLKDGTVLHIDNSKLWNNGLKIENAVSNTDSFDISSVIIGQLTLTLLNINDEFSKYDFTDCVASNVKVGLKLEDGTTESLSYGKFYLNETNYSSEVITLTFYDCLYKFDKSYSESKLQYPATLNQIVRDACDVCGVTMGTVTFDNDDYIVQERPSDESLTFRQVLLWVGQISVHYFYADEEGRLAIGWYHVDESNIDYSYIEETVLQDVSGDKVLDTSGGEIITNIETGLSRFTSLNTQLDDVVITGIRVLHEIEGENGQETITYQSGNDGYILSVSGNKMIQGDEGSKVASMIAAKVVGVRFRAFTASCLSDPTIECGDSIILADRKGTRYRSIVTNNTFQPGIFQNISCGAKSPARNSAERYSQLTQVYTDYRKELEKERTDREEALDELKERVDSSSGVFTTVETQPDGSNKYYLHDKPTLEESDIIWTMTAEAWSVSTDGGTTVNAGMTVDGDTIVRILTAVGVNADWIKTGAFRIEKNGEVMFSADTETGIIDIVANSFTLKGQSIEDIAENQVNDFVDAVYTPTIDNIQKQIDGQIETYYYDYEPTLENVPAIDWTSEEERRSHEGDLFYWKSRGYAYRFFKDGDTWKWQMVQDTDITKALSAASEAQDTADSKRRVFISTPVPPYDVGDLWAQGSNGDIMRCLYARQSGAFVSSDWGKASKYTDDSALSDFINGEFQSTIEAVKDQIDQKIDTWYQSSDPSYYWNSSEKMEHVGDLWYNTSNMQSYRWNGSSWDPMESSGVPEEIYDKIDGKAQVFVSTPTPPYNVGDLWVQGTDGDIMKCITDRKSGSYVSSDWGKASKYTDDTAVDDLDNALDQEGVFNRLTNNGQTQGIYLKNNRIYINATYIRSGTLSANRIKGGILTLGGASNGNGRLEVLNSSNQVIGTINNTGVNLTGVFRNRSGQEFIEMDESILKGGYGSTVHGRIDLSAQYSGGRYRTVVEALSGSLQLQASEKINIESIADFHEQAVFWVASKMYYLSHVSSGGHIVFASDGQTLAYLASSSKKYKDHVRDLTDEEAEKLLNARVVWFKYKENYLDKDDPMNGKEIPGFYAEELEEISPELIQYNNKGEAEDWNYRTMIPLMVKIIEKQQNEINELKNEISKIKETIGGLS